MRILLWVVLGLIAFFGFMNWPVLNTAVPLWLGVTTITAPLGTLILVLFGVVALLMLLEQSAALADSRRYSRDLDIQRKLADHAEASRFTELRNYLSSELARSDQRAVDTQSALLARVDQLERALRTALDQQGNALAATLGELDDRIERGNGSARLVR
ncbi:MAG TPA: LapA family protein [Burkholderiaceae bacterium]|nr:LapA family protein [Burkholderiaceae bacterium]